MKKIKIIIFALILISATSCSDFFDVNEPSNLVNDEVASLKLILPTAEYNVATLQFSEAYSVGQLQQHIASYFTQGIDQHYQSSVAGAWNKYYKKILVHLLEMEKMANEKNAKHYLGIVQILKALSLGMTTDIYGDMPYTEAAQGSAVTEPAVDSQASLYSTIQTLLDNGISNISATDNSGLENIENDMIYSGDLDKWKRLAYTLKARYAMHLTKKSSAVAQDALTYLQQGFISNDDDFQMFFDDKMMNPWYTTVVLSANTGNLSVLFSEQIVNYMNSSIYPTINVDPRLMDYVDNGGASDYKGAMNGGEGNDVNGDPANTKFNGNSYYFKATSPLVLVTYSEALYLKAEAEFLVNGGNTTSVGSSQAAYDAYKAGINANMNKIGIDPALRDAYLADPAIDVTPANLKLEHIMKEKYIGLLLSPEIYTDMRRYDFSTDVYRGLAYPLDRDPDMNGHGWPRRALYPSSEVDGNANITQINFWDKIWWDN